MVGSDFLAYVLRVFKRTDKDTEIYEATTDIIADIRVTLKTEDYKTEAFVTAISVLGNYTMSLPTDFGHLIGDVTMVDDAGSEVRVLNKLSKNTYNEKYDDRLYTTLADVHTDKPLDFAIYGGEIHVGPVPDATTYKYPINYTTEAYTEVAAGTDPVPFSERYRKTLRAGVLAEVYAGLEAFEESAYWRQMYNDGVDKIDKNDNDNIADKESVCYSGF